MDDVVKRMLDHMGAKDREIITIYYGENVDAWTRRGEPKPWCGSIARSQEVELVDGGQLYYSYILSSE